MGGLQNFSVSWHRGRVSLGTRAFELGLDMGLAIYQVYLEVEHWIKIKSVKVLRHNKAIIKNDYFYPLQPLCTDNH